MTGTRAGGLKTTKTIKKKYGDDFFRKQGRKGGKLSRTGGFAKNRDIARTAGAIGGKLGKPGYKLIKATSKTLKYKNRKTGEIKTFRRSQ